jgi:acetyl esterase/lipase
MPAKSHLLIALCGLLQISAAFALDVQRDLDYATVGTTTLKLDIYKAQKQVGPLIVWIHGGAWRSGSKSSMPLTKLVSAGFPIASVDYRLSGDAKFPAQIHDIKAAIRFLRANQKNLGLDATQIIIAGDSAGGHLAALVGVTNESREHEGTVGSHPDASSTVQGIISFYGAANLTTILDQSTPHGLKVRIPALDLFLGGQPRDLPGIAKLASPVFFVDSSDPPLLLFHGDQDPQMPINQAHELHGAYQRNSLKATFQVVHGAAHGGSAFYDAPRLEIVKQFLTTISTSNK